MLKMLAHRLSVSAPKMIVRRHVPWPLRLASIALAVACGAGATIWLWHALFGNAAAEMLSLRLQMISLHQRLDAEAEERQRLSAIVNAGASELKVEQSAAERLVGQLRLIEAENAHLKADLAYLESLLPAAGSGDGSVAIRRFQVEPDAGPNQLRYRALLSIGGRPDKEFNGTVQLLVSTEENGKQASLTWPDQSVDDVKDGIKIVFKHYQRVEGNFEVPAGAIVKSVQLRVLEHGTVRAQQTVTL
jgi:hypothetical protein